MLPRPAFPTKNLHKKVAGGGGVFCHLGAGAPEPPHRHRGKSPTLLSEAAVTAACLASVPAHILTHSPQLAQIASHRAGGEVRGSLLWSPPESRRPLLPCPPLPAASAPRQGPQLSPPLGMAQEPLSRVPAGETPCINHISPLPPPPPQEHKVLDEHWLTLSTPFPG